MSDSNMPHAAGLVVGTAGHIDHGKTTLVYALTGIETDTLKEEKLRGISIDLGFATMAEPGRPPISFIDVPGHERFIKNMLAGAAGIQAVVLIVAANESVKPQTREHFDICRLLGIRRGLIALTKCDLATPAQMTQATEDVRALVARSFLQASEVIEVSAVTGEGIARLRQALFQLADGRAAENVTGIFRLPVDRSFARKGFGAVVTGTLASGTLHLGDAVHIFPGKLEARVRGLQVHHAPVNSAYAGQRVAINLAGIEHTSVTRGNVIVPPNLLDETRIVDVLVDWLDPNDTPVRAREIFFHSGTSELLGTIKMNAPVSGSGPQLARVKLTEPLLLLPGDRFVLRRPSPALTVAGGTVLDPFPPRRFSRIKTAARLTNLTLAIGLAARVQFLVLESQSGLTLNDLVRMTGGSPSEIKTAVETLASLVMTPTGLVLARRWIEQKRQALTAWLREFHAKNPGAAGAPLSLARAGLDATRADAVFTGFAAIRVQADLVSLATHQAQYSAADTQIMQGLEDAFRSSGFLPPSPADVLRNNADGKRAAQLFEVLIKSQRLVRISGDVVFHIDVIAHIRNSLAQHKGRRFSVPEFKSWINISRKYAIPLLEYLDSHRVTRREGDMRIVL